MRFDNAGTIPPLLAGEVAQRAGGGQEKASLHSVQGQNNVSLYTLIPLRAILPEKTHDPAIITGSMQ